MLFNEYSEAEATTNGEYHHWMQQVVFFSIRLGAARSAVLPVVFSVLIVLVLMKFMQISFSKNLAHD